MASIEAVVASRGAAKTGVFRVLACLQRADQLGVNGPLDCTLADGAALAQEPHLGRGRDGGWVRERERERDAGA